MKLAINKLANNTGQIEGVPANPRQIAKDDYQKLLKSLQEDPDFLNHKPLHVYPVGDKYVVLGGNQRLRALKELGYTEVPVTIYKPDTPAEILRGRVIKDNTEFGEYDWDMMANDGWVDDPLEDWGVDTPDDWKEPDEVVEDEAPEVDESEPPKSRLGEIYQLGRHRVMCGSSTSADDVAELMDGSRADLVHTDPPYGVDYTGGHNKKKRTGIENDKLEGADLTNLFHDSISLAVANAHDHAAFYIWYASGKSVETYASFSGLGLDLRAVIQWYKVNSGLGAFMSQYIPNNEPCMYAFKTGCSPQWFGPSDEKTIWELKREGKSEYHPTQKPVELCARAISNSSKAGQLVYDAFGGSGSTLIACEQLDRTCYMMELDPKYVDVIRKRYHKFVTGNEEGWEDGTPKIEA